MPQPDIKVVADIGIADVVVVGRISRYDKAAQAAV